MAANTSPIFTLLGQVSKDSGTGMNAAITAVAGAGAALYDGSGAGATLVFTADPTNGSYVSKLRAKAIGTNAISVLRIWLNNGSTPISTPANNSFYGEISLPATTIIATAATIEIDYPLGFALPPGFRIYVGLGVAVVAGWVVTCIGGDY